MRFRRAGLTALWCVGLIGASACSAFVSLDGLDDGGVPDAAANDSGADVADDQNDLLPVDSGKDATPPPVDAHATVLPKFRAFAEIDNNGSGSTLVVPRSAQIVEGDLMIAVVYEYSLGTTSSAPVGWTTGIQIDGEIGSYEVYSYYRFAGTAEPLSYSFSVSTGNYAEVDLISYSGVDPVVPFDDAQSMTYGDNPNFALPQLTTTEPNELVLIVGVADGQSSDSWSAPSGVTLHKNTSFTFYGDEPQLIPAELPSQTLVSSVADTNGCVLVSALRPQ